jgi:hypothetical protein
MDFGRLIEIGPALLVMAMGIVGLWAWKGKFRTSEDADTDQFFQKAMRPLVLFAAICFFLVAVSFIFEL